MAELKRRVEPAVRLAQAGLPGRILGRLVEVGFLDRTVILAGQAFSATLPLFMVVSTVSPHPGGDSPAITMAILGRFLHRVRVARLPCIGAEQQHGRG